MELLNAAGAEGNAAPKSLMPSLADPAAYTCTTMSYVHDPNDRGATSVFRWLDVFAASIPTFVHHALLDESVPLSRRQESANKFAAKLLDVLNQLRKEPAKPVQGYRTHPLDCVSLCRLREDCLRGAGFRDVFKHVKDVENAQALKILPAVLAELDSVDDKAKRVELALRGAFAGNIFDLGAAAAVERIAETSGGGGALFRDTRERLLPRPWVVDDTDALVSRLGSGPSYRKVIMFVDNAGPDVVLGMLPLARLLLQLGHVNLASPEAGSGTPGSNSGFDNQSATRVVIAANELPSINDITAAELQQLLAEAPEVACDPVLSAALAQGRLAVVSSGNDLPVIDLTQVSEAVVEECQDADLVILEGMGRAIETNLHARFTCDSLKIGMIKHQEVAEYLGGRLYDCVCCFTPGTKPSTAHST